MTRNKSGRRTSGYSWSGGFLWVTGSVQRTTVAKISGHCARGATTVLIDSRKSSVTAGQRVTIQLNDDKSRSLYDHIYSGEPDDVSKIRNLADVINEAYLYARNGKPEATPLAVAKLTFRAGTYHQAEIEQLIAPFADYAIVDVD